VFPAEGGKPTFRRQTEQRESGDMPHHEERPATALAHGPAKPDDIERVRRDVGTAAQADTPEPSLDRALGEIEAACQTIRGDVSEWKRTMAPTRRASAEQLDL
jgi:hypothetical protein